MRGKKGCFTVIYPVLFDGQIMQFECWGTIIQFVTLRHYSIVSANSKQ